MLSAVVICRNEEGNIQDCLKSLSFCDEIIVIDDYSKDQTQKIIKDLKNSKIELMEHALNNDFSKIRNFGLGKAKNEWVLYVDADERVSPALAFEISNAIIFSSDFNGFCIKRRDIMWGKELKYGESAVTNLLRLGKKDFGQWEGKVHERWKIKGKVGRLNNALLHYPHKTLREFLQEINFYSTLRAIELHDRGDKVSFSSIVLFPCGKFLLNYFLRRGLLDGVPGLIFAITMSLHSFLVRGKLWILINK
ncbi:MAG: glycosyltransferase family 2 protein [Candidatus Levybacteria bacterium]|nr:glycosyltransferase family 2 protein [Candidatus Levybacteria bacterium]